MYDGYLWNDMPCEAEGLAICQWKIEYSEPSDDSEFEAVEIFEAGRFFRSSNVEYMNW